MWNREIAPGRSDEVCTDEIGRHCAAWMQGRTTAFPDRRESTPLGQTAV